MFLKQAQPQHQQVIKVHGVAGELSRRIALLDVDNLGGEV
jgi:hypothetical protein